MNWGIARAVLVKELRETLRDRRTLMIMIIVPAFLYPAVFVLMEQLALFGQRSLEEDPIRVAVVGFSADTLPLGSGPELQVVRSEEPPLQQLRQGTLEVAIVLEPVAAEGYPSQKVTVLYDESRDRSTYARRIIDEKLRRWGDGLLSQRIEHQGLPPSFAAPVVVSDSSVATPERLGGYTLGRFLPLILILMTVLGAFYPAIDLAAGEKERGTLEPLLTVPVSPDEIVAGKFAAVTLIALAAATLNLGSMLLTFQAGVFHFTRVADLHFQLPLRAVALMFGALLLLAVLFSSLFLGIAVRSHSFKEAQNALTPVYILSFLPAILATIPGIEFTSSLAWIPIAGVALLFRSLATGIAAPLPTAVAIVCTMSYALLALVFAVRAFGREEVLFGTGTGTVFTGGWKERLRAWQRSRKTTPSPAASLAFTGVVALLTFYVGTILQSGRGEQGLLFSQWLLLGVPALLFAALGPWEFRRTLALQRVSARSMIASLLVIAGGIPIAWGLAWLQSFVLELPVELAGVLESLLSADDPRRLMWLFFLVALTPAICEEFVFRGALLQGLNREMPMWRSVTISAILFGIFHLSFETVIRFLPTAWIGMLLGYVVWHTRSLFPSMLMHFVNNALAVLLVSSAPLRSYLLTPSGQPHWPSFVVAPFLLWLGIRLLPKRSTPSERAPTGSAVPEIRTPAVVNT